MTKWHCPPVQLAMRVCTKRLASAAACLRHPENRRLVSWLQVIAGEACRPKTANTWQTGFALVLALLTAGSCLQLGLSSNISMLPAVWSQSLHCVHRLCSATAVFTA